MANFIVLFPSKAFLEPYPVILLRNGHVTKSLKGPISVAETKCSEYCDFVAVVTAFKPAHSSINSPVHVLISVGSHTTGDI